MLFQLCGGASKMVFGQYLKNDACNSWLTLIDVSSQCRLYLGMNEVRNTLLPVVWPRLKLKLHACQYIILHHDRHSVVN